MEYKLMVKPKVLVVDLSIRYGGSTSRILSLMSQAPSGKIGVAVVESSAIMKEAQRLNIPYHVVGSNRRDFNIPKNLAKVIHQEGYQVVDTQNIQSKFWSSRAIHMARVAFVSTINSWYASEHGKFSLKGKMYTMLEVATNAKLNLYITVSENDRQALLRTNFPTERIELIYNAVNLNMQEIKPQRDWLIEKFSLPKNKTICTTVGRLVPIKGHDVLIQAVEQMAEQEPDVHFLIVGDGAYKENLIKQIQNANLENRITLAGYQNRDTVLSIVKSSDVFIMPSRYEGTPIALLEAAVLGIPIISSQAGGIPELVSNHSEALLVQPNTPSALAEAIKRIISDKTLAQSLARNAEKRVRENFSLERQFELTWKAYQKALNLFNDNQFQNH